MPMQPNNYSRIHNRPQPKPKKDERVIPVDENVRGAVLCNICCDHYVGKDMFSLDACEEHKYCRNCMADYLKSKVNDGEVLKIKCMDFKCEKEFTE